MWERERVMERATRLLDRARAGAGGALFIVGEAGLGKTSVLEEIRWAAGTDVQVAFGRGEEMEVNMPFGLAAQALGSLGVGDLIDVAGGRALGPTAPYFRVLQWLEGRPREPLVVLLDDLHWADADSLSLFAFLARRLEPLGVALAAALRSWPSEAEDVGRSLVEGGHAELVRLGPLSETSVSQLVAERLGDEMPSDAAHDTWELCRGNPLLVEQVVLALRRGERLPRGDAIAPDVGEHLLLARFAGVDPAALRCAQAGAVVGTSFLPELAAELAGLDDEEIDAAFDALFRSGLVVQAEGSMVRFAHPLVAQALHENLPPPVRRRYHARAFRLLSQRQIGDRGAEHALRAELVGDEDAIAVLEAAGRAALAAGAVSTGRRHLEAAVRFSGNRPAPALLAVFAEAAITTGHAETAVKALDRGLADRDLSWSDRATLLEQHGRALFVTGDSKRSEAALEEAVAQAAANDPERAVGPLLSQALSAWVIGGPAAAAALAARARELARDAADPARLRAEATWGLMSLYAGDPEGLAACEAVGERLDSSRASGAVNLVETSPQPATAAMVGLANMCAERFGEAGRAFALVREEAQRVGDAGALSTTALYGSYMAVRRGRLDDALRAAEEGVELAELAGPPQAYMLLARAEALLWLGRLEECERECQKAERARVSPWFPPLHLAHVRGARLLWQGDPAASDVLLQAEEIARSVGLQEPSLLHWAGNAAAAHVLAGRPADAERVAGWLEDRAAVVPGRWPAFAAALGRARIAEAEADERAAEAGFEAALSALDGAELPLHRAEGLLAHGGFLRRRGRQVDARPLLAEALRLAERSDAGWMAERAGAELRLAGGRRRRGSEDRDRLTAAERRVAEQAAAGHTNREIAARLHLSVHTVETHLKRVYSKLDIGSRRQLAGMDLDGD